jgi:hypothetical protein
MVCGFQGPNNSRLSGDGRTGKTHPPRCKNVTLQDFTYSRWELIVKYKTAFYSFYLPVALGMQAWSVVPI